MGADIYLNSQYEKNQKELRPLFDAAVEARSKKYPPGTVIPKDCPVQKLVEELVEKLNSVGYYRDSYNMTSLINLLDMSWWNMFDEGLIDDDGQMSVEHMKEFRNRLIAGRSKLTLEHVAARTTGSNGPAQEWLEYFQKKHQRLMKLLDDAIELDEPLHCSV